MDLEKLLAAMTAFALDYLRENSTGRWEPDKPLKTDLMFCEVDGKYLQDEVWFDEFPAAVTVGEIVEAINLLKGLSPSL